MITSAISDRASSSLPKLNPKPQIKAKLNHVPLSSLSMTQEPRPQPQTYEMVCLEHQGWCLYAEVIQAVTTRRRCWVRPLLLSQMAVSADADLTSPIVYDLRDSPDLVWPSTFFRTVMDMEVMPLLAQLQPDKPATAADPSRSEQEQMAQQRLRQLMRSIWQTYPEAFEG